MDDTPEPILDQTATSAIRPELICFSHLRWDFVWQRPQHLLSRAARTYRVFYVEEPVFVSSRGGGSGQETQKAHLDISERSGDITIVLPVLIEGGAAEENAALLRHLIDGFFSVRRSPSRVLWYYTPAAIEFTLELPADVVVYDNMDELSLFRGASPRLISQEAQLFLKADFVFTGGMSLFNAKRHQHPSVHAFPSSIDVTHYARARDPAAVDAPVDQATIPGPRIGFFGVIDERLDLTLLESLARSCPAFQFIMIGPVVKIDPSILPCEPNLHWLGSKPYADLPQYLAGWDVGFMPFALNDATRYISPTKTLEFLAAGVPLVSAPIADVVTPFQEMGLVAIARTEDEFEAHITALLRRQENRRTFAHWLTQADRYLVTTSWDKTWREMDALLTDVRLKGTTRRTPSEVVEAELRAEPRHA